ncbi:MAG: hypothetical protein IPM94_12235, partial [bacterium]|nr:hypothetical protein [bacterium]
PRPRRHGGGHHPRRPARKCSDDLPAYLSCKVHAAEDSLYNTPPVFLIWVSALVLEHVKAPRRPGRR